MAQKPVVMAVDDDPIALERISSELERRYGSDYAVVCGCSASGALLQLEDMRAEGVAVAVVLADQWLSDLRGAEFLARAKKLHPRSKRGLLIDFGDWGHEPTAGAIRSAMARGDVEYYVLKPWRCPDEEFHRTISEFLQEWARSDPSVSREVALVADGSSKRCHELCDLLARNGVPHTFHATESAEGRRRLVDAGLVDQEHDPVVFLVDGRVLVNPSNTELARAYGVTTELDRDCEVDVVVIGAGPAGLAAAVSASSDGYDALVIERESIGGQAGASSKVRNYLGFSRGVSGDELAQRAYQQAWVFGTSFLLMRDATSLRTEHERHIVTVSHETEVCSRAVILANGVSYRRLGVPALERFVNAGVHYGGSRSEMHAFAGQHVFVVGGGNSAGQAALHLARSAGQVSIVVRGPTLAATMSQYLREELAGVDTIDVETNTCVVDGGGDGRLERVTLHNTATDQISTVPAAGLFVFIGARPHTEWLPHTIACDDHGYVITGPDLLAASGGAGRWPLERAAYMFESSVPGVFAVGDVRRGSVKRVASAAGEGSVVMVQVEHYLENDTAAAKSLHQSIAATP